MSDSILCSVVPASELSLKVSDGEVLVLKGALHAVEEGYSLVVRAGDDLLSIHEEGANMVVWSGCLADLAEDLRTLNRYRRVIADATYAGRDSAKVGGS